MLEVIGIQCALNWCIVSGCTGGAFSIINNEDIIYVTGVEQYLFGIYDWSDVDVF